MRPKVSLILLCYRFEAFIVDALESLLNQQTEVPFEIIVVDDASPDASADRIRPLARDPRVTFIEHKQNTGAIGALTEAYGKVRGDYVARLDGDDRWYPYWLDKCVKVLDENPGIGMVCGDVTLMGPQGQIQSERDNTVPLSGLEHKALCRQLLEDYTLPAPTLLARKEAWDLVFPFPLDRAIGDFEASMRMLGTWNLHFLHEPLAYYRIHPGNAHTKALKNKTAEHSIMGTIRDFCARTNMFSEEEQSAIIRKRYRWLADSYFQYEMTEDARRCYRLGIQWGQPQQMLPHMVRYAATWIGNKRYTALRNRLSPAN